jgi:hypothetical protein
LEKISQDLITEGASSYVKDLTVIAVSQNFDQIAFGTQSRYVVVYNMKNLNYKVTQ